MPEDASISFEPVRPSPVRPWQIALASILFLFVIVAIVWRLRGRSQKNAGSLDLNRK